MKNAKLNAILDSIPKSFILAKSCDQIDEEFIRLAVASGFDAETAEMFMIGDASC